MDMHVAELLLLGAGGEPVDFARTIVSHGVAELPPNKVDLEARTLETTLAVPRGARTVRMTASDGRLRIEIVVGSTGKSVLEALEPKVAHMFRLDEDLSSFYEVIGTDDRLGWCATGAGRMLRAPSVFEDVVKTICTPIRRISRRTNQTSPVLKSRRQDSAFATGGLTVAA
jgi:3-methyladenine DNA glycosylase/8-oxoguanine DNA glycosylase